MSRLLSSLRTKGRMDEFMEYELYTEDTRRTTPRMGCALGISMGRFFDERNSLES